MLFVSPIHYTRLAQENEKRPTVHIPMVYEKVAEEPALWEYRVLTIDPREAALPDENELNELGSSGWILVGLLDERTSGRGAFVHYYFARHKQ
ncbi:MAG: hypothetical protein IMW89_11610 [Ktedonobacteraceae bacterium]|nr:hypothetical protein [Ktedonobacteraceae bacterium]